MIIFLIGMPCSGKSTLGQFIAKKLNYLFVDVDDEITNEIHGSSIKEYIKKNGWKMFRSLELNVFKQVIEKTSSSMKNVLISCGGGCIESIEVRNELCQQPYVIYINRHINDIKEDYLTNQIDIRPLMDLDKKLEERKIYYRQCSKYEFCLLKKDRNWITIERNLLEFIKRITNKKTQLSISDQSFFICLTYKNLLDIPKNKFISIINGCEAIELRVDLLQSYHPDFIGQQIAYIRKYTYLPIIYTVRSQQNYGTFQNNEIIIFQLLNYGIKFGCEFIDIEANWTNQIKTNWLNTIKNKHSSIIISLHLKLSRFKFNQVIQQCTNNNQVDIIKIALNIDNYASISEHILPLFTQLKQRFKQLNYPKLILIAMGEQGKLTRILNQFMTPVTHELLDYPAATGQLTVKQIQQARSMFGIIKIKQYYLFGNPIQQSLSPLIHQTAFDYFHLPYKYEKCQTNDISFVQNIINQSNFGGASITIPFKQNIFNLLISDTNNILTDSAKQIGAINTINKLDNGIFYGDNTDWKAIYKLINEKIYRKGSALIIGAGGTARATLYALNQIEDVEIIYLYNPRTPEKAIDLTNIYNKQNIIPITNNNINILENISILINTLPSSINFTLDHLFFEKNSSLEHVSILLDVNYIPHQTALIKQAQKYNWIIIYGIDMLIEQGLQQFQIWTGKANAVTPLIKETVYQEYHKIIDENQ